MTKAIHHDIKGIKCDNVRCDYRDMEVAFDPDKYLNMPCPKCGSNLFTPEDYKTLQIMLNYGEALNNIFGDVSLDESEYITVDMGMDGSGGLNIKVIDKEEE